MKKFGNIILWSVVTIAVLFAAYTVYSKNVGKAQTEEDKVLLDLEQMPDRVESVDFTLKDLKGNDVKLSDYRGKVVFLNFWATWCPPCQAEVPELEKANKELQESGLGVILAVDSGEPGDTVQKFADEKKLSFPVVLDEKGEVSYIYKITGIPTTYIINRDGTIFNMHTGPLNKATIMNLAKKAK